MTTNRKIGPLCALALATLACSQSKIDPAVVPAAAEPEAELTLPTTPTQIPAASVEEGRPGGGPATEDLAGLAPKVEELESIDQRPSSRQALERALAWATEGVRLYRDGDHEAARKNLSAARVALLDADLPEAMQEQGLSVLGCVLPAELGGSDLEAIAEVLELEPHAGAGAELEEHEYIERQVRRILLRFGAPAPRDAYLGVFVDEVQRYVDYYRGRGREFFERAFERKHKYWPTIEAVFSAKSIPSELGYMALVESGYNPRARSRANARGLWQFIPATGKRYGLRRTDDFYDVRMATEAASEYLLDLIGIFGSPSFLLATAAYNAGEARIQGCLRQLDDPFEKRSFWEIRDCLARETREYVPRIMAAAVIGTDPARFGFDLGTEEEVRARYDVATIPAVTRLTSIARDAGTTVAELRTANTDLASTATTTPVRNFPLYLPRGGGERLAAATAPATPPTGAGPGAAWPVPAPPAPRAAAETRAPARAADGDGERRVYRVRRGDTLSEIAEKHGVGYREVASWNQLRSPYRLAVGQELVLYPLGRAPRGRAPERLVYTVQRGNTLRAIADVFSVRFRDIMGWNDLRRSTLQVGQKLTIRPPRPVKAENYRVRRGDTVAKIARRFGVPVRDVLTANGLGRRSLIRPGERLVVYVGA